MIAPVVRIHFDRFLVCRYGLILLPAIHICFSEAQIAFIGIGRKLEAALQLDDRLLGLSRSQINRAQREMNFRKIILQLFSALGCSKSFLRPERIFLLVIHRQARACQTGIRQRKTGILLYALLEEVDR